MATAINEKNTPQSSIHLTQRTKRGLRTACLQHLIKPFSSHLGRPKTEFPVGSPRIGHTIPASIRKKCTVNERKVANVSIYDLTLKSPPSYAPVKTPYRIYYFAGGGWQSPPSGTHWKFFLKILESVPHTTLSVISYPLAPNSPAPSAFPVLLEMYNQLLVDAQRNGELVTIMGDSAGGNLALCLPLEALRINSDGPKPHSIMAMCPSVDMDRTNPQLKEVEKHDPILRIDFINFTAEGWRGAWDKTDPRVSPIQSAHLDSFRNAGVKVDGTTGGYDLLGLDGRGFRDKLAKVGVEGDWLDHDKMMHCWPLIKVYKYFPESNQAFDWITDVLNKRSREDLLPAGSTSRDEKEEVNV